MRQAARAGPGRVHGGDLSGPAGHRTAPGRRQDNRPGHRHAAGLPASLQRPLRRTAGAPGSRLPAGIPGPVHVVQPHPPQPWKRAFGFRDGATATVAAAFARRRIPGRPRLSPRRQSPRSTQPGTRRPVQRPLAEKRRSSTRSPAYWATPLPLAPVCSWVSARPASTLPAGQSAPSSPLLLLCRPATTTDHGRTGLLGNRSPLHHHVLAQTGNVP